jgi:hypothetical protein
MTVIGIHIRAADYSTFKELMPTEEKLGKDYGDWLKRRLQEDSRPGVDVTNVTVYPEEFRLYCIAIGQKPNYYVLEAFAASKERGL